MHLWQHKICRCRRHRHRVVSLNHCVAPEWPHLTASLHTSIYVDGSFRRIFDLAIACLDTRDDAFTTYQAVDRVISQYGSAELGELEYCMASWWYGQKWSCDILLSIPWPGKTSLVCNVNIPDVIWCRVSYVGTSCGNSKNLDVFGMQSPCLCSVLTNGNDKCIVYSDSILYSANKVAWSLEECP